MLDSLFTGVFDSTTSTTIDFAGFMVCMVVALLLGVFIAWMYMLTARHTKSFVTTLAVLPAVVGLVIMMVNGNVGAGVAVAGAFSLIRFRSVPGSAREIGAIFIAMGTGIAIGMGYVGIAIVFVIIISGFNFAIDKLNFGENSNLKKTLVITIPEDLNYTEIFDDLFQKYTDEYSMNFVKTTNMGSLFKLSYDVKLKVEGIEKALIDDLRCRNGNLEITISKQSSANTEL